ncbi:hypothetical protein SAMN04487770_1218 [Butyrivibrio sp. ob235]|nr:hypothetical protein SAMN04487770_1218 [Butyrivibrio sp. ob235]
MNYIRLKTVIPFFSRYAFLDTREHQFKKIFQGAGIKLSHLREFYSNNSRICLVTCIIRRSDEGIFESFMPLIKNTALLKGYAEYENYCEKLTSIMANT